MSYLDLTNEVFSPLDPEVWEAMGKADRLLVRGEQANDPLVSELEHRISELSGHEAAIFLPSTTVATRLYMASLRREGERVVVERRSHLHWMQHQVIARAGGMLAVPIDGGARGVIDVEDIKRVDEERVLGAGTPTAVVALENSHNVCGGTFLTAAQTEEIAETARALGAQCFLDGARVFDAAIAQGIGIGPLVTPTDASVIALTKSVGAPYGSMLTGSREQIKIVRERATAEGTLHVHRRGVFAAAALEMLDQVQHRVERAHSNAALFAKMLAGTPGISVKSPETNIVRVDIDGGLRAADFAERLETQGVGSRVLEESSLRFIPHAGLSQDDVVTAITRIKDTLLAI